MAGLVATEPEVIRVLFVEDSTADLELTQRELERAGLVVESLRVDTEPAMREALGRQVFDVVISDFSMPGFSGLEALRVLLELGLDVPFIFVSGVIGEERAVQAMRAGARDYVLKDNLKRLPAALRRELSEAADRRRRVQAEQARDQTERRYRNIFETAAVALFDIDASEILAWVEQRREGGGGVARLLRDEAALAHITERIVVRDANGEAIRMFEAEHKEALLGPVGRSMRPGSRDAMAVILEGLLSGAGTIQQEVSFETQRGRLLRALVSIRRPEAPDDLSHISVSVLDLTERTALEEQMRAAQRLEAVGRLAGGVAHDFNNLITVIGNYAAFLSKVVPADGKLAQDLAVISDATTRATALTRQLLTFSRREVRPPTLINGDGIVLGLEKILRRLVGEDVKLAIELGAPAASIFLDPVNLEQVVMNLVVNARDAMPRGGRLTIRTAIEALAPARVRQGAVPGEYVRLVVEDSGVGMDTATRARIFEPFFTTKEAGKGTGLGLATVYGIVKQIGGFIDVESEPGRGSRFSVYFPRAAGAPLSEAKAGAGAAPSGRETVLLVEDQDLVRRTMLRILEGAGYRVLVAADGDEALELAAEHDGTIACVVTDVVMPGLGVREMVDRLAAARRGLRVLFTSGYTGDVVLTHGIEEGRAEFLAKPFTAPELLAKLREILDGPPDRPGGVA